MEDKAGWKVEMLMEKLRAKSSNIKTLQECSKSLRLSLMVNIFNLKFNYVQVLSIKFYYNYHFCCIHKCIPLESFISVTAIHITYFLLGNCRL